MAPGETDHWSSHSSKEPPVRQSSKESKRLSVQELSTRTVSDFREIKVSRGMTVKDALKVHKMRLHRDRWVLIPTAHAWLQYWDVLTVLALAFVAVVTPAEAALLETKVDWFFAANRLLDLFFFCDMCLQFVMAYEVKTPFGHRLETSGSRIAKHYLRGWFFVDLVSILPMDTVSILTRSEGLQRTKLMKAVRLLRLVKLLRVLRASRVFHRWETAMAINYNLLKMAKAFLIFLLASHWIACAWAMMGLQREDGRETWVDYALPKAGRKPEGAAEIYFTSLYWSSQTVTSVGYGEIVPVSLDERMICTLLIFCSGFIWAYSLGELMAALGETNPHEAHFCRMLDDLNQMMSDRGLPVPLRCRMRAFYFQIKGLARVQGYKKIVDRLSISLQSELAVTVNEVWVRKVWYFHRFYKSMPPDFLSGLAAGLNVNVHAQQEFIGVPSKLYILHRGLCVRNLGVLYSGSVWGEDFILSSLALLDTTKAFCLTFVEVSSLARETFAKLVRDHPETWWFIRWAIVRMAAKRAIITEAKRRTPLWHRGQFLGFCEKDLYSKKTPRNTNRNFPLDRPVVGGQRRRGSAAQALKDLGERQSMLEEQVDSTRTEIHEAVSKINAKLDALTQKWPT